MWGTTARMSVDLHEGHILKETFTVLFPNSRYKYLDLFTVVFVSCLLAANIIAVKIIQIGPLFLPAGTIVFPISYIVNDVLTEVYGFKITRRVIWLGFLANLILVVAIATAQALPGAPFWDAQQDYERILGFAPRLLLASFLAYLVGSFANAYVMARMKVITKGRWLWSRTIGSTIVGEGLDSLVFIVVAFAGTMSNDQMINSTLSVWLSKTLFETVVTPLTYAVIHRVQRAEEMHVNTSAQTGFENV